MIGFDKEECDAAGGLRLDVVSASGKARYYYYYVRVGYAPGGARLYRRGRGVVIVDEEGPMRGTVKAERRMRERYGLL